MPKRIVKASERPGADERDGGATARETTRDLKGTAARTERPDAGTALQTISDLPKGPSSFQPVLDTESIDALPHTHGRVLVVDDNVDAADALAMLLQMHGYETRAAYDGQQAITLCALFEPDVVLMDIDMPVMDGYGAAQELRRHNGKRLVLIALTGRVTAEDRADAVRAGFDAYLTKPFDWEAVHVQLTALISSG